MFMLKIGRLDNCTFSGMKFSIFYVDLNWFLWISHVCKPCRSISKKVLKKSKAKGKSSLRKVSEKTDIIYINFRFIFLVHSSITAPFPEASFMSRFQLSFPFVINRLCDLQKKFSFSSSHGWMEKSTM